MRIKNILILVVILLVFCGSIFFLYQTVQRNKQKKDIYQSIPFFELSNLEGVKITNDSLAKGRATLFLFFDPACGNCKSELKQIQTHQEAFRDFQIVFFSTLPANTVSQFLDEIAFVAASNMYFLVDDKAELMVATEVKGPPTSLIYNRKNFLTKRFDGPVKVETLIKYLSE